MCMARWLLYLQIASIPCTKYMRGAHYVISGAVVVENGAPEPFRILPRVTS